MFECVRRHAIIRVANTKTYYNYYTQKNSTASSVYGMPFKTDHPVLLEFNFNLGLVIFNFDTVPNFQGDTNLCSKVFE